MSYSIYRVTEDGKTLIGKGLSRLRMAAVLEEETQRDRENGEAAAYEVTREEEDEREKKDAAGDAAAG